MMTMPTHVAPPVPSVSAFLCLWVSVAVPLPVMGMGEAPQAGEEKREDDVCFVAEMADVRELACLRDGEHWSRQDRTQLVDQVARARAAWKEKAEQLAPLVTADRVRDLSRWALRQMRGYSTVPALAGVPLQPIGLDTQGVQLVLEGTIDTLPTHHHLVTRWLKVYVLYDLRGQRIAHMTFTIRGQKLE